MGVRTMNVRVLALSMLLLLIFSLGPLLIGWHRQIWAWVRPQLVGTLGRVGRPLEGKPESSPLIWVAFGGPLIAILGARDVWGSDAALLSQALAAYPVVDVVGIGLFVAGQVGLILGRRAGRLVPGVRRSGSHRLVAFWLAACLTVLGAAMIAVCVAIVAQV